MAEDGMPVKVTLQKSSRESTSETTIDWRTDLVTDRRILRRWPERASRVAYLTQTSTSHNAPSSLFTANAST